jgi:archaemetzincin
MRIPIILALIGLSAMSVEAAPRRITLVPCGMVPPALLDYLKDGIKRELKADVAQVAKEVPVPSGAYDPRRRQYRAEAFRPLLTASRAGNNGLVLGVTKVDLFVPELNFVFGLADSRQKCAVISLARLQPEFYDLSSNPQLFQERALKEALHELGHLLGLGHCPNPACIMYFSNSLADTDRKGPGFCPECRRVAKGKEDAYKFL